MGQEASSDLIMALSEQEKHDAFAILPPIFTKLIPSGFTLADVTSEGTARYNCIAYAAKDESQPWWPMPHGSLRYFYWPPGLPRQSVPTKENFFRAFEGLGYKKCKSRKYNPKFERVVLYVDNNDVPTHMARELGDGIWYSKLGNEQDIRQHTFDAVENQIYGTAKYFMRKRLTDAWYTKWLRKLLRTGPV